MAHFSIHNIAIRGIAATVPGNIQLNSTLDFNSPEENRKLIETLGIEERRVSLPHQCASDFCIASAEKLIEELNWSKSEIDVLFFVSQTPDYQIPGSAVNIVHRLKLNKSCISIDINQGCAGYVYGLSLISGFMTASGLKKGLLLVGDTITKVISPFDKSLIPLFSDCGTATALEYKQDTIPFQFNMSGEGEDYEAIIIPEGGGRVPLDESSNEYKSSANGSKSKGYHLHMKGLDVFNFSLKKVVPNIEELFSYSNTAKETIDYFIFHQANLLLLNSLGQKLKVPADKIPVSLGKYGNTSNATIPLTIVNNLAKNKKVNDITLLLSGFGVGLSLGSCIIKLTDVVCPQIIELE